MEEKLYNILRKHKIPFKKREAIMIDLLDLFLENNSEKEENKVEQKKDERWVPW